MNSKLLLKHEHALALKRVKECADEVARDEYAKYTADWQGRAVAVLNEFYFDRDRYEDEIFDTTSDEWDELVARQVENRGWLGVKYFLSGVSNTADWARLDGYGNGEELTGADLVGLLEDAQGELDD